MRTVAVVLALLALAGCKIKLRSELTCAEACERGGKAMAEFNPESGVCRCAE